MVKRFTGGVVPSFKVEAQAETQAALLKILSKAPTAGLRADQSKQLTCQTIVLHRAYIQVAKKTKKNGKYSIILYWTWGWSGVSFWG